MRIYENGIKNMEEITVEQIRRIVQEEIKKLNPNVLESEITDAQNKIKSIVEQASF